MRRWRPTETPDHFKFIKDFTNVPLGNPLQHPPSSTRATVWRRIAIICPHIFCPDYAPPVDVQSRKNDRGLRCPFCGHSDKVVLNGFTPGIRAVVTFGEATGCISRSYKCTKYDCCRKKRDDDDDDGNDNDQGDAQDEPTLKPGWQIFHNLTQGRAVTNGPCISRIDTFCREAQNFSRHHDSRHDGAPASWRMWVWIVCQSSQSCSGSKLFTSVEDIPLPGAQFKSHCLATPRTKVCHSNRLPGAEEDAGLSRHSRTTSIPLGLLAGTSGRICYGSFMWMRAIARKGSVWHTFRPSEALH